MVFHINNLLHYILFFTNHSYFDLENAWMWHFRWRHGEVVDAHSVAVIPYTSQQLKRDVIFQPYYCNFLVHIFWWYFFLETGGFQSHGDVFLKWQWTFWKVIRLISSLFSFIFYLGRQISPAAVNPRQCQSSLCLPLDLIDISRSIRLCPDLILYDQVWAIDNF